MKISRKRRAVVTLLVLVTLGTYRLSYLCLKQRYRVTTLDRDGYIVTVSYYYFSPTKPVDIETVLPSDTLLQFYRPIWEWLGGGVEATDYHTADELLDAKLSGKTIYFAEYSDLDLPLEP
jgi:hypothetical protein